MKRDTNKLLRSLNCVVLFAVCLPLRSPAHAANQTTRADLLPVGEAVVRLFETAEVADQNGKLCWT